MTLVHSLSKEALARVWLGLTPQFSRFAARGARATPKPQLLQNKGHPRKIQIGQLLGRARGSGGLGERKGGDLSS